MVLGITGTNGAGKGAVVEYLKQKGFTHYSIRDLLIEELHRRGLELNRINTGYVGTALRQEHGPAYFTKTFLERAQAAGAADVVIESIRTIAEAEYLKSVGGFVVAVDAPEELRYERIVGRDTVTDKVSLEEFRVQEDAEYRAKDPSDPTQMNVLGVMAAADYTLANDGTYEELEAKVDQMLDALRAR